MVAVVQGKATWQGRLETQPEISWADRNDNYKHISRVKDGMNDAAHEWYKKLEQDYEMPRQDKFQYAAIIHRKVYGQFHICM